MSAKVGSAAIAVAVAASAASARVCSAVIAVAFAVSAAAARVSSVVIAVVIGSNNEETAGPVRVPSNSSSPLIVTSVWKCQLDVSEPEIYADPLPRSRNMVSSLLRFRPQALDLLLILIGTSLVSSSESIRRPGSAHP